MSTWVVQVVVVALFALTCGALAAAWMRGRLGVAAIALFVVALVVWVVAFAGHHVRIQERERLRVLQHELLGRALRRPRSPSSPLRCSSRSSALAMLVSRGEPLASQAIAGAGEQRVVASSFKLPDLGEGLTEGEVARWLVTEGQEIAEDDPLVEIQTDKATVEIPSPYAGTVLKILVAEGDIAPVGTELVVIGQPGEAVPVIASTTAAGPSLAAAAPVADAGRVQATPVVRRIAQELGVDLAEVAGSGPGRPDHGGRRESVLCGREHRRPTRAPARRPPRDRRAHGPGASRGATRDLGGGV